MSDSLERVESGSLGPRRADPNGRPYPSSAVRLAGLGDRAIRYLGRNPHLVALGGILVAATVIRLWQLGTVQVLWYDEITSYYNPYLMLRNIRNPLIWSFLNTHVPTLPTSIYVLTYSTTTGMVFPAFFSTTSAFWIRLPSVVFGVVLVGAVYGIGSELFNKRVGLVAASVAAITPWTFYWSRFSGITSPLEVWTALAIYVIIVANRNKSQRLLMLSVIFGVFTVYTSEAGIAVLIFLIAPFWLFVASKVAPRSSSKPLLRRLFAAFKFYVPFLLVFICLLLPLLAFEFQSVQPGNSVAGSGQLLWEVCKNTSCATSAFSWSAAQSWSPDFLAFTGGLSGAQPQGFEPHMSIGGVWQSGGGFTGMLTILGLLVYPALLLLVIKAPRRWTPRDTPFRALAILVVLSYTIVGGIVYYDNPNAARLAFAAGLLEVFISWLLVSLVEEGVSRIIPCATTKQDVSAPVASSRQRRRLRTREFITVIVISVVVLTVGTSYVSDYFLEFHDGGAQYFIPQIKEVGALLSELHLWSNVIFVQAGTNITSIVPAELAFYDAVRPPNNPIVAFNGSVYDERIPISKYTNGSVFVTMVGTNETTLESAGFISHQILAIGAIGVFWISGERASYSGLGFLRQR